MRTDERTDRHYEASRRYSQFSERALKVINVFPTCRFSWHKRETPGRQFEW